MARPRAYLAGPDVFLPNRAEFFVAKGALCDKHGLDAAPPLDAKAVAGETPVSQRIYRRNIALMDGADLIIANLTPFRGPSADVGTVFELGYGLARGIPVFGYSNDPRSFFARVESFAGVTRTGSDGRPYAPDGFAVEDFGLIDNLMIDHALEAGGGLVKPADGRVRAFTDLDVFELCLARAAAWFFEGSGDLHHAAAE